MDFREMDKKDKEYTNGEITVIWKPDLCDHSAVCLLELPKVFDNTRRPWVNMQAAPTKDIIETVNACPTMALTFKYNKDIAVKKTETITENATTKIVLVKGGPIRISGKFTITDENGKLLNTVERVTLCRCGKSGKMPFCDGSHI